MFDYNNPRWKRKQKSIMRRDNYMCQNCRKYGRMREANWEKSKDKKMAKLFM